MLQTVVVWSPIFGASIRRSLRSGARVQWHSLPAGLVRPVDVPTLRVMVEGQEMAVAVGSLGAFYGDGTVRAVLVQFRTTVPALGALRGQLRLGGLRTAASIPIVVAPRNPQVVALPNSPEYLRQTGLTGPLPPAIAGVTLTCFSMTQTLAVSKVLTGHAVEQRGRAAAPLAMTEPFRCIRNG